MRRPVKTVKEKFKTKLNHIKDEPRFSIAPKTVKVDRKKLFGYTAEKIEYTNTRYFPSKKEDLVEEDFRVTILLDHETLKLISSAMWNPPRGARVVIDQFRRSGSDVGRIIIGSTENKISGKDLHITTRLYKTLLSINKEEGSEKVVRVQNRIAPFLESKYDLEVDDYTSERDYSLLLEELVASKSVTQDDILKLTDELSFGEKNKIVIEKQINKQAEWLLDSMQEVVDTEKLTVPVSKELGRKLFGFPKVKTNGPEDLMEKILTEYGKNIIFGVPYLLNTNKFVVSKTGVSKSQFDLVLVNLLSDIEIVELKRPDEYLLDYDPSRGKFFISKELGVAVSQAERYVSAILRDNDSEFSIGRKTIRNFIESEVGGTITLSVCRPTAIIIIGRIQNLAKPYEELTKKQKQRVTKAKYNKNAEQAYQELKGSYKNIQITTYSELIETSRLRLQQESSDE